MRCPAAEVMISAALLLAAACSTVDEPKVAAGWDDSDAARPLAHADCVRLAVHFAPTAAAWQARLAAAEAALAQAGALPNPSLGLMLDGFSWAGSMPASWLVTTISLGTRLDELFSVGYRRDSAQHDLAATIADLQSEQRRLSIEVCRAYDRLVAARERAVLEARFVVSSERQRDTAQRLQDAGRATGFEVARAAADAAQAAADAETAEASARQQELAFAFALGFHRPIHLELADALPSPTAPGRELAELLTSASEHRPELAAANARYAAALARANLKATSIRFLPTVTVGVEPAHGTAYGLLSIDAELPVFDSGDAEEDLANAELLAAAAGARLAAHAVAAEVTTDVDREASAIRFLDLHANRLVGLRRALATQAEGMFTAGGLALHDLLQLQRDLVAAERLLIEARLAAATTSWPLEIDALLAAMQP